MSIKFQMTIPEGLAARLKREAARQRIPLAQLIRETMEERLRRKRGKPARDPFASITNLVDAEETDLSARADEILYG